MALLPLKLILTPLLITLVTLAGRRWGPGISGWLIGFPLTSGPVSLILALQDGRPFAVRAAVGSIGGQGAVLAYCLVYALLASRLGWLASVLLALTGFILADLLLNAFTLSLLPSFILVTLWMLAAARLMPATGSPVAPPVLFSRWDLPARMLAAGLFVLALTSASTLLGPQLSGLISPFPIFGVILAVFAHRQQGPVAAVQILRGMVSGSLAFTGFFLVVAAFLPVLALPWTYLLATITALAVNLVALILLNKKRAQALQREG